MSNREISPPEVTCRLLQPDEIEAVNAFYNDPQERPGAEVRGYVPRTTEQWLWEFNSNNLEAPPYAVSLCKGRIVGSQAFIPIELIRGGEIIPSEKSEDTLINLDYRGMGLLDEMYALLLRRAKGCGVGIQWGFTTTAVRPLLRSEFKSLGKIDELRADLNPVYALSALLLSGKVGFSTVGRLFKAIPELPRLALSFISGSLKRARTPPPPGDITVTELECPDECCDRFSYEFSRQWEGFSVHLSAGYLKWRLYDNPFFRYKVYAANFGDEMVGLAAFKLDDRGKIGKISELVAIPTEKSGADQVLNALLQPGLEHFRRNRYKYVIGWAAGEHPFTQIVRSILHRHGFSVIRKELEFMVRTVSTADDRCFDLNQWRLSEIMTER